MTATFFAAYLLSSSLGLIHSTQTPLRVKPIVSPSKNQHPRGKNNVGKREHLTQAQLLQGAWSECSDCDGDFLLKGNREVIFYDPGTDGKQELVHWKVSNNKLSFIYKNGDMVTDAIVKLTKDSLVLYRRDKEAGVIGYSRFVRLK